MGRIARFAELSNQEKARVHALFGKRVKTRRYLYELDGKGNIYRNAVPALDPNRPRFGR
jgi:hypothetical protein